MSLMQSFCGYPRTVNELSSDYVKHTAEIKLKHKRNTRYKKESKAKIITQAIKWRSISGLKQPESYEQRYLCTGWDECEYEHSTRDVVARRDRSWRKHNHWRRKPRQVMTEITLRLNVKTNLKKIPRQVVAKSRRLKKKNMTKRTTEGESRQYWRKHTDWWWKPRRSSHEENTMTEA